MAEFDSKPMPPEYTDPTAPPPYDMHQPQPQPPPQPTIQTTTYVFTVQPAPIPTVTQVHDVPDHLGLAWFACLCCFFPLGLVAIMMAKQSKEALECGNVHKAQSHSKNSRCLSMTSIRIGIAIIIIVIINVAVRAGSASSSRKYN